MIAEFGGNDVKCAKYATFGTKKLANNVLNVIENRAGCLISNHGQLTVADNLEKAVNLSIALEKLSKQYFLCSLQKGTKNLTNEEMIQVSKLLRIINLDIEPEIYYISIFNFIFFSLKSELTIFFTIYFSIKINKIFVTHYFSPYKTFFKVSMNFSTCIWGKSSLL